MYVYLGEPENLGKGLKFLKNHFSKNILVLKRQKKKIHRIFFFLVNQANILKLRNHKSVTNMAGFITSQEFFHHKWWVIPNKVV